VTCSDEESDAIAVAERRIAPALNHRAVIFAFFGHPGAGKSTLCRRFGELNAVPALDTDTFMTAGEVAAILEGRYTQTMRLANIERYCARVGELLVENKAVAIADGLPNQEARRFLVERLSGARVVFVLVTSPRELWEKRLASRTGSPVGIDVAAADRYVRANWEDPPEGFRYEVIENRENPEAVDDALRRLYGRYLST
jgi:adenylate kinase family enzyme